MEFLMIICLGGLGLAFILKIASVWLSRTKCPKCKSSHVIKISGKETWRQQVLFKEKEILKHVDSAKLPDGSVSMLSTATAKISANAGAQDSTTIREYKLPGLRIHYLATYKCENCEDVFTEKEYVDIKPPTVN